MPNKLSRDQIEKTKKYSIIDGSAYNVMTGFGEQYVNPFAIRLGASDSQIGILSSVPYFLGSLSQLLGAKLTDKFKKRRSIIAIFVFTQALTFLPLFLIPLITKNIVWMTALFSLYVIFGSMAGPAWNSLIGDVIEDNDRARFFSRRNKIIILVMVISVLCAGLILNYFTTINVWAGFGILFGIALIGRLISGYYIIKHFEPTYVTTENNLSFGQFLRDIPRTNFGKFVVFRTLVSLAVNVAAPFFAVYMLKDLGFNYLQYTAIVLTPMIVKILTMQYWGKFSYKVGNRNILYVSVFLIALIPIVWFIAAFFFEGTHAVFYVIMLAEAISGFGWAGFELCAFNYMLENSESSIRAKLFAYYNVLWGTCILIGGLAGAYLIDHLPHMVFGMKAIVFVFLVSAGLRFLVPILFIGGIKDLKHTMRIDEGKLFFDIVFVNPALHALNYSKESMLLAEKGFIKVQQETVKVVEEIAKPVGEIVDDMNDFILGPRDVLDKVKGMKRKKKRNSQKDKTRRKADMK
jgi:MFS family permease